MEKADGRQVALVAGGGFSSLLHIEHIGGRVPTPDVGQLLQMVFLRKQFTEPLHGLVIPLLSAETALSVVLGGFVQLGNESLVDTGISRFYCHSIAPYFTNNVQMGIVCLLLQAGVSA